MKIIGFGFLLAGILLIRKTAWKHISRCTQYAIWFFPAFFLLFHPFLNISSQYSLENTIDVLIQEIGQNVTGYELQKEKEEVGPVTLQDPLTFPENNNGYQETNIGAGINGKEELPGQTESVDFMQNNLLSAAKEEGNNIFPQIIYHVLTGGFLVILSIIMIRNIRCILFCRKNRVFYKELDDCKLKVYMLKGISSPFLLGKNIYIDTGTIQNKKMLRHIIIHEYCHFRHHDNLWALVRNLCLALNWYNPFVWLANDYVKRDCELACDEAALSFLDEEEKTQYGYTLLAMIQCTGKRKKVPSAAITMSGNMKRIKERIGMIHSTKNNSSFVVCLTAICMILLTGCTFTQKEEQAASTVTGPVGKESNAQEVVLAETMVNSTSKKSVLPDETDDTDTYYNVSADWYGGMTYLSSDTGLYVIPDGSSDRKLLYEGSVTLGTIAEGYLFFYAYPEDREEAAVMSLELSTGKVAVGCRLGEKIYDYHEMCNEKKDIYISMAGGTKTAVYTIKSDGSLKEKEILSVTIPEDLKKTENDIHALSPVISKSEGYSGNFYAARDEGDEYYNRLYYYEDNTRKYMLENITDVMITSKGIIGRDASHYRDVYLWDVNTKEKHILYSSSENNDLYFGYNTYDDRGLYGLWKEDDHSFYIGCVSWDGALNKLFLVENVTDALYGIHVQMSVIHDSLYYYNPQNGGMECLNLKNT